MIVKRLQDCNLFTAGDGTQLREILNGPNDRLDLRYSLAHAMLPPGQSSKPHQLATSEVYFLLAGQGIMHINGEQSDVVPGDTIYIPPSATQFIESTGTKDLVFICIVDPAWRKEDEEIV